MRRRISSLSRSCCAPVAAPGGSRRVVRLRASLLPGDPRLSSVPSGSSCPFLELLYLRVLLECIRFLQDLLQYLTPEFSSLEVRAARLHAVLAVIKSFFADTSFQAPGIWL